MLLLLASVLRDKVSVVCRAFETLLTKLCIIDIAVLLLSERKCKLFVICNIESRMPNLEFS